MEDLVYAQMVIKKPIYFYEEEKHCSFVLIDAKEICVYILKANNEDELQTFEDMFNKENADCIELTQEESQSMPEDIELGVNLVKVELERK